MEPPTIRTGPVPTLQRQPSPASAGQRNYSEDCSRYIHQGGLESCEFYRCREANTGSGCGPGGYYLGYGLKYCDRFARQLRPNLSAPGQRWLDETRVCLMERLQRVPFDADCAAVKQAAFDSHPACYVRGGICFLPSSDWALILSTIDLADNDLKQVLATGGSCLANWGAFAVPGSLSAGGGLRGLMERDRQRAFGRLRGDRPPVQSGP